MVVTRLGVDRLESVGFGSRVLRRWILGQLWSVLVESLGFLVPFKKEVGLNYWSTELRHKPEAFV